MRDTNNLLSVLESYMLPTTDEVARKIADDFRCRRVEKAMTREMLAKKAKVALANITRFEQKGLISLTNLIKLAVALGYLTEVRDIFSEPKFSTMEELLQIRANKGKKKAYPKDQ